MILSTSRFKWYHQNLYTPFLSLLTPLYPQNITT